MTLLRKFDNLLYRRVTHAWPETKVATYTDKVLAGHDDSLVPAVVRRHFEIIDAKAATLLVHSSMMVAAIGIVATLLADDAFQKALMIGEVMLFLGISIVCLRCTSLFREPTEEAEVSASIHHELILRRELFIFCNTGTIYLTILVLVTLPIVLVL